MKIRILALALLGLLFAGGAAAQQAVDIYALGVAGQAAATNNIIPDGQAIPITTAYGGACNVSASRGVTIQINVNGTVSAGTITFEGSMDGVNFVAVSLQDLVTSTSSSSFSPATGVTRYFWGPLALRFFRARISTALTGGGSVQSVTRFLSSSLYSSIQAISGNPIPQSGGGTGSAGPYTALHLIGQNAAGTAFADTGISYTANGRNITLNGGALWTDDGTGQATFSTISGKNLILSATGAAQIIFQTNGGNSMTLTGSGLSIMSNASASNPGILYAGTWFVGGNTTTNLPQLLLQPTGTTAGSWNASGTGLGINAPSGFSGDLINLEIAGVSKFRVDGTGYIVTAFLTSNTGGLIVSGSVSSSLPMKPGGLTRTTTGFTATSNTVLANVTALTATVAAGQSYKFHAWLPTTATTAGGVQFAISGTATATNIIYEGVLTATATGFLSDTRVASLGSVVGSSATATSATCIIDGTIVVNAGGTLTVQFAQNTTNASASTVLQGANFEVTQTSN